MQMPAVVVGRVQDEVADLRLMQVQYVLVLWRAAFTYWTCGGSRHWSSTGSWDETLTYTTRHTKIED